MTRVEKKQGVHLELVGKGEGHLIFGIQDVYINTDVLILNNQKKKNDVLMLIEAVVNKMKYFKMQKMH